MLVTLLSPIPELQHAPLPPAQSVASQGTCPDSLPFRYFYFGLTFESIKKLGGASISNNTFMCFKVDQLPIETMDDKGGGGHKIDDGHHKCSGHVIIPALESMMEAVKRHTLG